jgi:polyisoprenoid-binding protein YceI
MKKALYTFMIFATIYIAKAQTITINATLANPCSTLSSIENSFEENNFLLFPNPSKGIINIQFQHNSTSNNIIIKVYDVVGKLVFEKQQIELNKQQFTINLDNIKTGIYFITVQKNNSSTSKKLIIN